MSSRVGVAWGEGPLEDSARASIARLARAQDWTTGRSLEELLAKQSEIDVVLERADDRWQVRLLGRPDWNPLYVDFSLHRFSEKAMRAQGKSHPMARALGPATPNSFAIDATAGLGADAYVIAWLGFRMLAVEQNAVAFALLEDGLARAPRTAARELLKAQFADSERFLRELADSDRPDVVYLDPMYPEDESKTALPKKAMQLFRSLVERDDERDEALLDAALSSARRRVVIKRPPKAPYLGGRAPSATHASKTVRFDVHILKR